MFKWCENKAVRRVIPLLLCLYAIPGQSLCLSDEALTLRDAQGRKIGQMKETNRGLEARDCRGNLAGGFDPKHNQTRDKTGRLVGKGFLLPRLFVGCP